MTIKVPRPVFDDINYIESQSAPDPDYHDDFNMTKQFLIAYKGSKDTFKTYRREVERLLQWAWNI